MISRETKIEQGQHMQTMIKTESKTQQIINRIFDIIFSVIILILLFPIFLIITILIKIKSPQGKVFFTQNRLGLNGKLFKVYKFRTMIPNAEEILEKLLQSDAQIRDEYFVYRKLKTDPRIIPLIGDFLRKTSLDELPQFLNVLIGDMSVVGPRPYIENEFLKHPKSTITSITSVKPGVTGLWQVTARSATTFNGRVEIDLAYIEQKTFIGDIKIIFQTVLVMVFRKGAY